MVVHSYNRSGEVCEGETGSGEGPMLQRELAFNRSGKFIRDLFNVSCIRELLNQMR